MLAPVRHRPLITACLMTAVLMQVLDSTIANVALPYMQGSLNTTIDQISWVLTSYVIASAIMTAPVGWLAARFGRKQLIITCLIGFVITSMMCGAAQSLEQMVVFRILQGACGAALVPLSQASMLDIYTAEQRASAMAVFGIGVMVGPILGPTLGGYLTEAYNWRWVFYVNLPIGIIAVAGLIVFMPPTPVGKDMKFDWTGFAVLAIGVGSLQMMLDRGQSEDWFNSPQIMTEAVLAGLGVYLFLVHMFTTERPFIPLALFRDRYFTMATMLMFMTNTIMMASSALLAPYLQNLSGYPVATAGTLMAPRGIGTMVAMVIIGRLGMRANQRLLMFVGLTTLGLTLHDMSTWTPDISAAHMVTILLIQGFAMGWVWNPITLISFTTLPASLRGDATALQSLMRNVGSAIGISVTAFTLARGVQISHSGLTADLTPFNRLLQGQWSMPKMLAPWTTHGAELLDQMVNRQALIIAYANDFRLMSFVVIPALLLLLLVRRQRTPAASGPMMVAD